MKIKLQLLKFPFMIYFNETKILCRNATFAHANHLEEKPFPTRRNQKIENIVRTRSHQNPKTYFNPLNPNNFSINPPIVNTQKKEKKNFNLPLDAERKSEQPSFSQMAIELPTPTAKFTQIVKESQKKKKKKKPDGINQ